MKKVVSLLLVAALALCVCFVPASALASVGGFGDTNADGEVSASDALSVLKHVVGKGKINQADLCFSDVNFDYKVDASDALDILKRVVGKINRFTADDNYYVNIKSVDGITVKKGSATPLKIEVTATDAGLNLFALYDTAALQLASSGGEGAINLAVSALSAAKANTVYPLTFYVENHPTIYKIVYVTVVN